MKAFLTLTALALLSACSSGGSPTKQQPAPTAAPTTAAYETDLFKPFTTAETVDALAFGMAPAIDSTAAFQAALGAGNRTVKVPAGKYLIGSVKIPARTVLVLAPGVVLRDTGRLGENERMLVISKADDVQIIAQGARLLADRRDYTTGEQRHGVDIRGSRNVKVEGLEASGMGGDGFYVGGLSENVTLRGVLADNNRRQGLSITSARDVRVYDSTFSRTKGTAPEFGVDLEPNDPVDLMVGIYLVRVHTPKNKAAGIGILFDSYTGGPAADITIVGHTGGSYLTSKTRPEDSIKYL